MSGDLKKLYSEIIKAHNETPFHFEKRDSASHTIKAYNPICGDRFEIFIDNHPGKINEVHFHGFGCAISKASTSVLTKSLVGKMPDEAIALCSTFLDFINKKLPDNTLNLQDDFQAFIGVHDFPERYDCATLSWREMKKFLESNKKNQ
ncbi:MAG: SUF system NifU family Fe-S cluster assembly protein [Bacteroidia bacterium]|nr:SUF system NifU family Fe-S cluster assembly protein [Bacteroidia bacterium]